jgi:hypothetical protein
MPCRAPGSAERLLEERLVPAIAGENNCLLNDRLLSAEECQTPLVEAGLDIFNALKDSIILADVKAAPVRNRCNMLL